MPGDDARQVPRPDPDRSLVDRARAGDVAAFEWLVLKHRPRVERLLTRLTRGRAIDVEDLSQETFIRAYHALPTFRGDSQFFTWLYRIAVNTAKKALHDAQRDPVVLHDDRLRDDEAETSAEFSEPSHDDTPETLLAAKEIAQTVNAAVDALPDEFRQALMLREAEGWSYDDIARAMDTPVGTVRSRIYRAREAVAAKVRPLLNQRSGKRW